MATVDDLTDVLNFDSEDIDGIDDDAGEEQEPPPTGRWTATSSYDIYIWWTPPKRTMAMRLQKITPKGGNQSMGVIGIALSPTTAISAQEMKTIQMLTKMNTTLISLPLNRPNRSTGMLAQENRRQTEI